MGLNDMAADPVRPVFDGHNDCLLRLYDKGGKEGRDEAIAGFLAGGHGGQMDLPRMRSGGFVGGLFAIYPPSPRDDALFAGMRGTKYELPLPAEMSLDEGRRHTFAMASIFLRLVKASQGAIRQCRTAGEIRAAIAAGSIAAVLHIEGAEAIDPDLEMLDILHAAGLASIGMVWSRPNIFAHGVPMKYPATPDTGPGLTEHGRALVKACNARGILLDLSHLNEQGFWDVAALSGAPLVATHSNVHAITPHARNLTGKQLAAIGESGGLVGLNYATAFLRPDGQMDADTSFETMARHLDALIEALGEDGVGLGSDFDGAIIPDAIGDVAGLPGFFAFLREHGYGDRLIAKIACANWLSLLERTFKA